MPQVAPPTNSDIDAPVGEALVAVPAEPATFTKESSHAASPEVGEFQQQFSQLGDKPSLLRLKTATSG